MINYNLKINFQDEKVLSSDIVFVSGDIGAYRLKFDFYDNGKKVDVSKYALTVKAKRADGVKIASAGKIEDGQAVFIPENNIYSIPGDLYLEVALCDATGKYITAKVIIASVIEGLGETDVKGTETPSVYVTLLSNLQSKIDQANQLINESIEEKEELVSELDTKIDDVNKSIDEIKIDTYNYSNAVKGFCKGELIRIDDVSPNEHIVKFKTSVPIRVTSKNMISYPYAMSGKTSSGITFTVNHDNTITVKGTATANVGFTIVSLQQMLKTPIGTYYLSGCPAGGSENTYYLEAVWYKNNVHQTLIRDIGSGAVLRNSAFDRADVFIQITIKAGTELPNTGITFKPQFEVGSKASPYEPPTTVSLYTPNNNNMVEFVSNSTSMTIVTSKKDEVLIPITADSKTVSIQVHNSTSLANAGHSHSMTGGFAVKTKKSFTFTKVSDIAEPVEFSFNAADTSDGKIYAIGGWEYAEGLTDKNLRGSRIQTNVRLRYNLPADVEPGNYALSFDYLSAYPYGDASGRKTPLQIFVDGKAVTGIIDLEPTEKEWNSYISDSEHYDSCNDVRKAECEYNRDTNKVIEKLTNAIISLGGNV